MVKSFISSSKVVKTFQGPARTLQDKTHCDFTNSIDFYKKANFCHLGEIRMNFLTQLPDAPLQNHEDLLEVSLRIPYGVICLASALAFHRLTTFIPKKIDLAVPQKRKLPKLEYPPLNIHYFSESTYQYGIEQHDVAGHGVHVYSTEKTLVDLLRLKQLTLFAEGLNSYLSRSSPRANLRKLLKAAEVGRVEKRLRPLLEVMTYDTAH